MLVTAAIVRHRGADNENEAGHGAGRRSRARLCSGWGSSRHRRAKAAVTVGAKLGASPGPKGPQVGPIVRFMAFTIFFPEQVHGRAPTVT
jgi:hypothetical protein